MSAGVTMCLKKWGMTIPPTSPVRGPAGGRGAQIIGICISLQRCFSGHALGNVPHNSRHPRRSIAKIMQQGRHRRIYRACPSAFAEMVPGAVGHNGPEDHAAC